MRTRLLGLPAAALAAGVPTLIAGLLGATTPLVALGPDDSTVRTVTVDPPPPEPTDADLGLEGAHPPSVPVREVADAPREKGGGSRGVPVRVAGAALPARVLLSYRRAVAEMARTDPACHIPWSLLAGIGQVESGHAYGGAVDQGGVTLAPILGPVLDGVGAVAAIADTDGGTWDGDPTWDRAVGPMQFIPSSWQAWGRDGDGDEVADPSDVDDASLSAAVYLCAGDRDLRGVKDRRSAVFSYNHSWDYVDLVLAWAQGYATGEWVTSARLGSAGDGAGDLAQSGLEGEGPALALQGPTAEPTSAPTSTSASASASAEPVSVPTQVPDPSPTESAPAPTAAAASPTPTETPTATPTSSPTATPTETPTAAEPSPSPSPTDSPTGSPTGTPTESPTPTPEPTETTTPTATSSPT